MVLSREGERSDEGGSEGCGTKKGWCSPRRADTARHRKGQPGAPFLGTSWKFDWWPFFANEQELLIFRMVDKRV
ncbi:Protein of unknown function [Gryllus bimaculatus]|nr:Protein of unknown function [Gryllus bimaculatus]